MDVKSRFIRIKKQFYAKKAHNMQTKRVSVRQTFSMPELKIEIFKWRKMTGITESHLLKMCEMFQCTDSLF